MNDNERDELWDLLGKARQPQVSPFFARNVVREVRAGRASDFPWWKRLALILRPVPALASAIAVALLIGALHHRNQSSPMQAQKAIIDQISSEDLSVVADLDELIASQDSNVWLQSESSSL